MKWTETGRGQQAAQPAGGVIRLLTAAGAIRLLTAAGRIRPSEMGRGGGLVALPSRALRAPDALVAEAASPRERAAATSALVVSAALGLALLGVSGLPRDGAIRAGWAALMTPASILAAFALVLPALLVFGTALGARLSWTATALAAGVGASVFGTTALAVAPILWFFAEVVPSAGWGGIVETCVLVLGFCAGARAFWRAVRHCDPNRSRVFDAAWLALLALVTAELLTVAGLGLGGTS